MTVTSLYLNDPNRTWESVMNQKKTVDRMADVMVERCAASGSCTKEDLRTAGFTEDAITAHGENAQRKAAARMATRNAA